MYIKSTKGRTLGLLFLFVVLFLSLQVRAQSGFVGQVVIDVDDASVTATVDKPEAEVGATVTLTLTGLTGGKMASVTAGL